GRFLRSVPHRWAALIIGSLLFSAGLAGIFAVPAEAAAPPISPAGASIAAAKTSAVAGSIGAGGFHTCGIRTIGTVACWGDNPYGQATPPPRAFTAVSAGDYHTSGIRTSAPLACRGDHSHGQASPSPRAF